MRRLFPLALLVLILIFTGCKKPEARKEKVKKPEVPQEKVAEGRVNITWFGHAMFLLQNSQGLKIITDPYDASVGYSLPEVRADIVTVSHEHFDHNNVSLVKGNPQVIRSLKETAKGISFEGISSFHDEVQGIKRGKNTIYKWKLENITFAHLGDLGHDLTQEQADKLRDAEVILIPVGGTYTIDAKTAQKVVQKLNPKIVLPMHYKTAAAKLNIASVDEFLEGMPRVEKKPSTVSISASKLPLQTEIWLLDYIH